MELTRINVGYEVGIVLVNTISDGFKILRLWGEPKVVTGEMA